MAKPVFYVEVMSFEVLGLGLLWSHGQLEADGDG